MKGTLDSSKQGWGVALPKQQRTSDDYSRPYSASIHRDCGLTYIQEASSQKIVDLKQYEKAFNHFDQGFAFQCNAQDPYFLWGYIQSCYFTSRFRLCITICQILLSQKNVYSKAFYADLLVLAAIVLKHLESFDQSRQLFCTALKRIPSKYNAKSLMMQVCRCTELSGNAKAAADLYQELYYESYNNDATKDDIPKVLYSNVQITNEEQLDAEQAQSISISRIPRGRVGSEDVYDEPLIKTKVSSNSKQLQRSRSNISSTLVTSLMTGSDHLSSIQIHDQQSTISTSVAKHNKVDVAKTEKSATKGVESRQSFLEQQKSKSPTETNMHSLLPKRRTEYESDFIAWFWDPKTWEHAGDVYSNTMDMTLAADAYFAAVQRYSHIENVPDSILFKCTTCCLKTRNLKTASTFIDILVERDPGYQLYIDLYMKIATQHHEAAAARTSITIIQRWFRKWILSYRRVKRRRQRNAAARIIQRVLYDYHNTCISRRNFASSTLQQMVDVAVANVMATNESHVCEYLNDTAYFLCAAKYFRLWRSFTTKVTLLRRRSRTVFFSFHAPYRHFKAWFSRGKYIHDRLMAMQAQRKFDQLNIPFCRWFKFLERKKLEKLSQQKVRDLFQKEEDRQHHKLAEQTKLLASVQQAQRVVACIKIQAFFRKMRISRVYKKQLGKVKFFWASLVQSSKSSRSQAPPRASARRFNLKPSIKLSEQQIESVWHQHPCQYPGRLLYQKEAIIDQIERLDHLYSNFLQNNPQLSDSILTQYELQKHSDTNDARNVNEKVKSKKHHRSTGMLSAVIAPRHTNYLDEVIPSVAKPHSQSSSFLPTSVINAATSSTEKWRRSKDDNINRVVSLKMISPTHRGTTRTRRKHKRHHKSSKSVDAAASPLLLPFKPSRHPDSHAQFSIKRKSGKSQYHSMQDHNLPPVMSPRSSHSMHQSQHEFGNRRTLSSLPQFSPALDIKPRYEIPDQLASHDKQRTNSKGGYQNGDNEETSLYKHDRQLLRTMKHLVNHSINTHHHGTCMHGHAVQDNINARRAHRRLHRIEKLRDKLNMELMQLK